MDDISRTPIDPGGALPLLRRRIAEGVEHEQVFAHVCEEGLTTPRFVAMSALSAAIAILGLLLSSPAVVIGAMLLSPLMGPIILLGFSFWMLDWSGARRALASLIVGLGLALAVAVVLTWLSPLKEPTAEILGRARPNLFDLLIAAFSGIAGGYAVIRQRGETVIGVAIATALMPPIATVGFGLGTRNWPITLGALLLFATNLIAIALAAAGMAALYGFRPHYRRSGAGLIGNLAVLLVVAGLCVPLTLSLNTIAVESRATTDTRHEIRRLFGDKARIASLSVRRMKTGLDVDGLIATPAYQAKADEKIGAGLTRGFGLPAHVSLDQVVLADPRQLAAPPAPAAPPDRTDAAVQALRQAVPFPTDAVAYDPASGKGVVVLAAGAGLDLPAAMTLEQGLRSREEFANVEVIPALQPLPPVTATLGRGPAAAPVFGPELAASAWALARWRAAGVNAAVCGLSPADHRWKPFITALGAGLQPAAATITHGGRAACAGHGVKPPFVVLTPSAPAIAGQAAPGASAR